LGNGATAWARLILGVPQPRERAAAAKALILAGMEKMLVWIRAVGLEAPVFTNQPPSSRLMAGMTAFCQVIVACFSVHERSADR
jgi:hypothetical protein